MNRPFIRPIVPAFENLASLDRLPPTGATVIALPMKIGGGSGAPGRRDPSRSARQPEPIRRRPFFVAIVTHIGPIELAVIQARIRRSW